MTGADIAEWIYQVHQALAPRALERAGAWWGPVRFRHRTLRPAWFGGFDRAWANPIDPVDGGAVPSEVDVITAGFADLPVGIKPPPIRRGDLGPRGEVVALADSPTRLTWNEAGAEVFGWDAVSGRAIHLRAEAPSGYDLVSPLRWLVHWGIASVGGVLMHAACVGQHSGRRAQGALLLGDAGHGKSTTTLACLTAGWVTCGDDAVAVLADDAGWFAQSVYAGIKTKVVDPAQLADEVPAPSPATVTWEIEGRKRVHLLTSTSDRTLVRRIELAALILLDPASSPDQPWSPGTAAETRNRAAPSTALPLPFERQAVLERIGALTEQLPCYRLPRRATMADSVADVADIVADAQARISVVIPVYDGERYLGEAVGSILRQTTGRFQIIVVDDGTPDGSVAAVERMRPRVEAAGHTLDVLSHGRNRGIGAARNTGIAHARHPLVAFLDQDDTWPPERTAVLLQALRRDDALVALGRMSFTDLMPDAHRPWVRPEWFDGDHPGSVLGAVLCRAELFDQVGVLNPDMRTGYDDVDWFARLRDSRATVAHASRVVVERRIHDRNQSRHQAANQADIFASVRAHLERAREAAQGAAQ